MDLQKYTKVWLTLEHFFLKQSYDQEEKNAQKFKCFKCKEIASLKTSLTMTFKKNRSASCVL